jgi:hypothetical protein
MPRIGFIINGWDMLRDGPHIPTKKHVFPGLPHAFRRRPDLPSSKRWDHVSTQ